MRPCPRLGHSFKDKEQWKAAFPSRAVSAGTAVNPFTATQYNNDFLTISGLSQIDFASFNVYPDLWNVSHQQQQQEQQHHSLGSQLPCLPGGGAFLVARDRLQLAESPGGT